MTFEHRHENKSFLACPNDQVLGLYDESIYAVLKLKITGFTNRVCKVFSDPRLAGVNFDHKLDLHFNSYNDNSDV